MKTIKIQEPEVCPYCGGKIERLLEEGAHIYCTNPNCPEKKIIKLSYFVSKDCMNIEGLSEKTLRKLNNTIGLNYWYELYKLKYEDFIRGGCGEITAKNLVTEISKSLNNNAVNVLIALGIPSIGKVNAKKLLEKFGSIRNIDCAANNFEDKKTIDIINCIGDVAGQNVITYFTDIKNADEIHNVYAFLNYNYISSKSVSNSSKLFEKVILATGTFKNFSRDGIKDSVISNGGTYASGVSKKLSFIIVGDKPGSSKIDKANELNIKMISEDEYIEMIQ